MWTKYPRTPHLPWSPGATADDVRLADVSCFEGREVVVTEKLDGECTTLYRDGLHARSLDSAHHPSRAWVKALQARIARHIPRGWRIAGENVYALHSIAYAGLPSYFFAFSIWTDGGVCLDWDETVRFATRLGIPTPRVRWRGRFDARSLHRLPVERHLEEGYVVRAAESFAFADFASNVAKWVRPSHVTTDAHWMEREVVPNGLGPSAALWEARAGGTPSGAALRAAIGLEDGADEARVSAVATYLDAHGRMGDARLAGLLAGALGSEERAQLGPELVRPLGMRLARTVADLVGRQDALASGVDHEDRPTLLRELARGSDLVSLIALAATGEEPDEDALLVSELMADDLGLLESEAPWEPIRAALDAAVASPEEAVRDRALAAALDLWVEGRIVAPEQACALARGLTATPARLLVATGPSGSGKSSFAASLGQGFPVVSLDAIREERGDRADRSHDDVVLSEALRRLGLALRRDGRALWDATGLDRRQRRLPIQVGRRLASLVTLVSFLVPDATLTARNRTRPRTHAVPADVLAAQLRRRDPPYPGEADRVLYVDAEGTVGDVAGSLADRTHAGFEGAP